MSSALAAPRPAASTPPVPALARGERAFALARDDLEAVEARLAERLESPMGRIPEVGAHLLAAGGKRLRPLLAVLGARAGGAPPEAAVAVGCAAELIHTATLYHDDVVDDGRVRRGRPAARMVYGNGVVVLVGDFCLARALETVAATGDLRLVQSLAATVTEMAEGEVAQLEGAGDPEGTVARYFEVIDRKTASLIAWAARVGGALAADADAALGAYGRAVGRSFQIADDILDCTGAEDGIGKTAGRDLREGKLTLPVLLACDADPGVRARIRAELREDGVSEAAAAEILKAVRTVGGVEAARRRAGELAAEAARALGVLPASPHREALQDLAYFSVERVA